MRRVELSMDAGSTTGAPRLYGLAGMRPRASYVVYRKGLPVGEDVPPA